MTIRKKRVMPGMADKFSPAIIAAQKYLTVVQGASLEDWMDIWAENAVVEFPYSPDSYPRRLEGRDAIYAYYKNIAPAFELRTEHPLEVACPSSDPRVAIFEISLGFFIRSTGNEYLQDYICVVKVRGDGRIVLWREYSDPLRALKAIHPDRVNAP
jgi:uncharacterized protein